MLRTCLKPVSLFTLLFVLMSGGLAKADSVTVGLGSGWSATYDDDYLGLLVDITPGDSVRIEKIAVFSFGPTDGVVDPLSIVFTHNGQAPRVPIWIQDEFVQNLTGFDWIGFRMSLGFQAVFDIAASQTQLFLNETAPFASNTVSADNKVIEFHNGLLANGDTWMPGNTPGSGSALIINPTGNFFVLKEQPHLIPLPPAAWSGLSALAGIALVGSAKNFRRLVKA